MNIATIVSRALQKEQRAYNLLFDLHWDYVFGYVIKKTKDPILAEEIALKCFSNAFDKIEQFNPEARFSTWLISIANNLWIDHQRHSNTTKSQWIENRDRVPDYHSPQPNPEEEMIANQKLEQLLLLIQSLAPNYRQLIQWRYFDGLSHQEMAEKLQQPVNTVKVKLFRAKKILAEKRES